MKSHYSRGPVIAKLPPGVSDITEIAKAAVDGGADILSLINTMPALAIDTRVYPPKSILGNNFGGLSGPAIKPIGLSKVCQVYQSFLKVGINSKEDIKIPIIGIGGIMTPNDAIEYMAAGASAIQIGTVMFIDDCAYEKITKGIEAYLKQHNYTLAKLIGSLKLNPIME